MLAALVASAVAVPVVLALRPAGPAGVTSATPAGDALASCRVMVDALPQTLDGAPRRTVRPDDGTTAAWGEPAIVLRCGVAAPDPVTVRCVGVDGVDWAFLALGSDPAGHPGHADGDGPGAAGLGFAFRSYGRTPVVEVVVPAEHAPEAEVLVPLAAAVSRLPLTGPRCVDAARS